MDRVRVVILFGGYSSEYGVSLQSAAAVAKHMNTVRYEPVLLGISREGNWFRYNGPLEKIEKDLWCNPADCTPAVVSTDRSAHQLLVLHDDGVERIPIDCAFPVLHGKNGEDGTVQGIFELAGIPLVGCGSLSSALCMDKNRAHRLVHDGGIAVPEAVVLGRQENLNMEEVKKEASLLGYPVFIKPVKSGSSWGITRVLREEELEEGVRGAFLYDDEVIMEKGISGFEVGCAIMGNEKLTLGEVDEVELKEGFFDYTEKYSLKTSKIHVPARISLVKAGEIKEKAQAIYRILGCRGFARVDMFVEESGRIVFNEVNTIPGFTPHSRFPAMMRETGISFEQVISSVIEMALKCKV